MRAMILNKISDIDERSVPLELVEWPDPTPKIGEILIHVSACGVCHTELDEIEGRAPPAYLPIILGHQVIGKVEALGEGVTEFKLGDRVGVAWIFSACGKCIFCLRGDENLCSEFQATGRDARGGYAELMVAPAKFSFSIPDVFSDVYAAPLLCAGAIGYRALRLAAITDGQCVGLMGFGASAHLVLQIVRHQFPTTKIFVFARNEKERNFAHHLGATWVGDLMSAAPEKLHAIIDTTPAWAPMLCALENLLPGGRLVINAIRKEDKDKQLLQNIEYPKHLWLEKEIKSVANITRMDVREFFTLAATMSLQPDVQEYALEDANQALYDLKTKYICGAKVLRI